jgi:hypothetical protein
MNAWREKLSLRSDLSPHKRKRSAKTERNIIKIIPDFPSEYSAIKSRKDEAKTPIMNLCLLVIEINLLYLFM